MQQFVENNSPFSSTRLAHNIAIFTDSINQNGTAFVLNVEL